MIERIRREGQVKELEKEISKHRRISDLLNHLEEMGRERPVTLKILLEELGSQTHGFLIILLSLPFLMPIPIPGLSVIFGLLISLIATAWMFAVEPWIPNGLRTTPLPEALIRKAPLIGRKIFTRLEYLIRPRLVFMVEWIFFRLLISLAIIIAALFLALPLPPGTNFPPAILIFILAFSIIERDGLLAVIGMGLFVAETYIFSGVALWIYYWVLDYF